MAAGAGRAEQGTEGRAGGDGEGGGGEALHRSDVKTRRNLRTKDSNRRLIIVDNNNNNNNNNNFNDNNKI